MKMMMRQKSLGVTLLGLFVLMHIPEAAAQGTAAQAASEDALDPSAAPDTKYQLTPALSYGATFELTGQRSRDLDFDRTRNDRFYILEPELEFALAYQPGPDFLAFSNFELADEIALQEPEKEERPVGLAVDQAYLLFKNLAGGPLSAQLGRQKFKDERSWLFDENLDAVRAYYRFPNLLLDLSVSRLDRARRDLLNRETRARIDNYLIHATSALSDDAILTFYGFKRRDRRSGVADRESPLFLGLHSSGDLGKHLEYWMDLAQLRGRSGPQKIRAYGADLGATVEFALPAEPSLTLGYAFGSGDANSDDGIDRNFRQTGLQDNEGRYNGVAKFQYYGEVFDPELSNLAILTAAIGVRPTKRTSVDLVYHRYAQHKASDRLRDAQLDAEPSGLSRKLGSEFDLVLGYRKREGRKVRGLLTFGYFDPGPAFTSNAKKGLFARFEIKFEF